MYDVQKRSVENGAEIWFVFDLQYPIRDGAIWVRPAEAPGTSMNYELEFFYSEESQELRNKTVIHNDSFFFQLIPANKSTYEKWNFPLQLRVRVKNLSGARRNFYCALVAKQLDEQG